VGRSHSFATVNTSLSLLCSCLLHSSGRSVRSKFICLSSMAILLSYTGWAIAGLLSFIVLRAIYRVTLHPLAKFPGPRLAAITSGYQAWYDLRPSSRGYVFQFPEMHKKYGGIEPQSLPHGHMWLILIRAYRANHTRAVAGFRHRCV
jgi:hypothetical protein